MVTAKQVQLAYVHSAFVMGATVLACFALIYLRFVDADVLTLSGVFFVYLAAFRFSFVSLKRARALAGELSIEGSVVSPTLRSADRPFDSASLPTSERPPRSTPKN